MRTATPITGRPHERSAVGVDRLLVVVNAVTSGLSSVAP